MAAFTVAFILTIIVALFSYLAFRRAPAGEERWYSVWKTLSLVVVMLTLILLAKTSIDANQVCDVVVSNSTIINNVTVNAHSLECVTGPYTAGLTLYKYMIPMVIIFFLWLVITLFVTALENLRMTGKW
jgi:hypothetical protein